MMSNLFAYLVELNIALVILYTAYKIFFERDKNFLIRRIYLIGVIILPFLLPLMPQAMRMPVSTISPISINIEGVTVLGSGALQEDTAAFSFSKLFLAIYLLILAFGVVKLETTPDYISHIISLLSILPRVISSLTIGNQGKWVPDQRTTLTLAF